MGNFDKSLEKLLRAQSDANFDFADLVLILKRLDFQVSIRGSHHIFRKSGVPEILNLQPLGSKAKVYQVKQVRQIIINNKLLGTNE